MKFFPRELCEKLQKLGCKSESESFYICGKVHDRQSDIQMFSQNDLTGCHPQARENAKIVWGDGKQFYCPCCEQSEPPYESQEHNGNEEDCFNYKLFYYHRHVMIDAPDAEEYLKETMKEVKDGK